MAEAVRWLARHGVSVPRTIETGTETGTGAGTGLGVDSSLGEADPDVDADSGPVDPEAVARAIVLGKLASRARTRYELDQALRAKKVPTATIQQVLDRMASVGLVDDAAFASAWVESRQQRRHLSAPALRRELEAKGLDRCTIDAALAPVDSDAELAAARALVERKSAAMADLDGQVRYRRLAGLLSRRGFGPSVIARVLGERPGE